MQLSDRSTGLGLAGLGVLAVVGAARLPPMPGQPIGPSIFPIVIGAGLLLCGALIALGIGRSFEDEAEADVARHAGDVPEPAREPTRATHPLFGLRPLIPIAALLLYALAADTVGFAPVAAAMVFGVAAALGAGPWRALALALVATPLIHLVFAKLLRVPLPPGLLPMPW